MQEQLKKVLQPSTIFELVGVKNTDEASRVFSAALSFLLHMPVGSTVETSSISVEKLAGGLIYVKSTIGMESVIEELNNKGILKIPI